MFKNDKVQTIPNFDGYSITPSYVAFTNDGRLVGQNAKDQTLINSKNVICDVKRLIGRRFGDIEQDIQMHPYEVINENNKPVMKVCGWNSSSSEVFLFFF